MVEAPPCAPSALRPRPQSGRSRTKGVTPLQPPALGPGHPPLIVPKAGWPWAVTPSPCSALKPSSARRPRGPWGDTAARHARPSPGGAWLPGLASLLHPVWKGSCCGPGAEGGQG